MTDACLAIVPLLLAAFFLWFFRDPERAIPQLPVPWFRLPMARSPGLRRSSGRENRAPHQHFSQRLQRACQSLAGRGVITAVEYRRGKYLNAMNPASAELNEQNICTLRTRGRPDLSSSSRLPACWRGASSSIAREGERVARGERIGLIKFGSRCDVILPASAKAVKVGEIVKGGSTILAILPEPAPQGT